MDIHSVLVGCGKMGGALLSGWLKQGKSSAAITVIEPETHASIGRQYGVQAVSDYAQVKDALPPHVVIFAVKPQLLDVVLPLYADQSNCQWHISIAAGKPLAYYEAYLGAVRPIIRAMPNLPATIAKGITGLCANTHVTNIQRQQTETLFRAVGECLWLQQDEQMDVVTAISGSGPAYLFYFIECLRTAGQELGLSDDIAHHLALSTVYGSACLAQQTDLDITDLRKAVTSPKGTTEAALNILQSSHGLQELVLSATKAAKIRARELSKG